jgi:DNA gyrase subunit A
MTVDGHVSRSYSDEPPKVTASDKEPPRFIMETSTAQILYLFTDDGRCATVPMQQLPQSEDPAGGMHYSDLSPLTERDTVTSALSLPNNLEGGYLFLATEQGQVKRLRQADLPGMSSNVFTVMNVGKDDRLRWAFPTDGRQEIILTSNQAQAIRFKESDVRPTGLPAGGMRGIKLGSQRARVVGASIAIDGEFVWTITNDGFAKISSIDEYPTQGRGGGGVITMRLPKTSTEVAAAAAGRLDARLIALSNKNKPLYMRLERAPEVKRGRAGGDSVIAMTRKNEVVEAVVEYQPMRDIVAASEDDDEEGV